MDPARRLFVAALAACAAAYVRVLDARTGRDRLLFAPNARTARRLYENEAAQLDVIVRWRGGANASDGGAGGGGGFSAQSVSVSQLKQWRRAGLLESVEQDVTVRAAAAYDAAAPVLAQIGPPSWGLDRVDQRFLPLDARYFFRGDGEGVLVFIVDSGAMRSHSQLAGRVLAGRNFNTADQSSDDTSDCGSGHGSHIAGIIGGVSVGVAKGVSLVPVRVYGECPARVRAAAPCRNARAPVAAH